MSHLEDALDDYTPDPADFVLPEKDEEQLQQSQKIRQLAIATQTKNGTLIPTDKDEREFLIKMLDGKDKVSVQRLRIQTDSDKNTNDSELAHEFARLANKIAGVTRPERVPGVQPPEMRRDLLPEIEVVPGQMDVGSHNITFNELKDAHSTKK